MPSTEFHLVEYPPHPQIMHVAPLPQGTTHERPENPESAPAEYTPADWERDTEDYAFEIYKVSG